MPRHNWLPQELLIKKRKKRDTLGALRYIRKCIKFERSHVGKILLKMRIKSRGDNIGSTAERKRKRGRISQKTFERRTALV